MKSLAELASEGREIYRRADAEGRGLTPSERGDIEGILEVVQQRKTEQGVAALDAAIGPASRGALSELAVNPGPGDVFIDSKGYREIQDTGSRPQTWSTGAVEVPLEAKGTLTSSPGTALVQAGYAPGVVPVLFPQTYLADLIPNREAPGNPVRFVAESSVTNAAAPTAETGLKPESTLVFGETSEPIRKIATWVPLSDELLKDAPNLRFYLNSRLSLFVKQVEEAQLLLGSGTAPNLQGFVASGRAIGTYARGTVDDNATALFKAANGTRGSSFLNPDTVVIHPTNWQAIRLGKDASGQYYGGGPFYGAYGGNTQASSSQFSADSLWGMRVVVTSNITVGTALVGAFAEGATLFRKGGLRVEATNSHGTYFTSNVTAIRAEMREALCVFRPSAFVAVTGLAT
jgi:HK97 family phage major capsid protein